jgi:SAM-dependent methyltransferase
VSTTDAPATRRPAGRDPDEPSTGPPETPTADPPDLDPVLAGAFAERMVTALSDAFVALMTSVGHRVGLFDTLSSLPPATSTTIADAAGLDERYVREWLGAMTTGGIVTYDPASGCFDLPPEHATCLTRAAGPDNIARITQFVGLLGAVEEEVVDCFRDGGGVPYAAYPRFQQVMAEDSRATHDATLLDVVLPLVEGLPARLTRGIDVADIGCGSGHAINLMARAYPESRFTGFDISQEGIAAAEDEAARLRLPNARFEVRDVARLDIEAGLDLITAFDAIHDQAEPALVLAAIARALRPGGVFLMVDIRARSAVEDNLDLPWAPFLYGVSTLHCMTVSLAQGGAGLGTVWGEELALRMLADAGFTDVTVESVDDDPFNAYYVARRD